jgi:hypothetical protein
MMMNQINHERDFAREMILELRCIWRFINGFNDGKQDFQFFVNAADGQADCIHS